MMRKQSISRAVRFLCGIGLVIAASAISERASAQPYYQCPYGYYYLAGYGCAPLSYYYGPPYYAYPNYSFGFFYGGRWGGWGGWPRYYGGRYYGGHGYSGHTGGHPGGHPGGHGARPHR